MSGIVGSSHNIRGSGVVAKLGTDGQVFTSAGAGVKQTFEAAGGGAFTKLITITASDDSDIVFDSTYLTTSYQDYMVILSGLKPATDGQDLYMRVSIDGGSSFKTGSNYAYGVAGEDGESDYESSSGQADTQFTLNTNNFGSATGEVGSATLHLYDPLNQNSDDQYFHYTVSAVNMNSGAQAQQSHGGGMYDEAGTENDPINGIQFYFASGNIAFGEATIYGRTT